SLAARSNSDSVPPLPPHCRTSSVVRSVSPSVSTRPTRQPHHQHTRPRHQPRQHQPWLPTRLPRTPAPTLPDLTTRPLARTRFVARPARVVTRPATTRAILLSARPPTLRPHSRSRPRRMQLRIRHLPIS